MLHFIEYSRKHRYVRHREKYISTTDKAERQSAGNFSTNEFPILGAQVYRHHLDRPIKRIIARINFIAFEQVYLRLVYMIDQNNHEVGVDSIC